ncbi:hypothetical protein [Ruegeria sp. Alg231-54]|uniref:hypothetical protein n=1 Tax=Ruegeria sp. Alg231-54 TaxID=1922221 RepID=UPI00131F226F|nr:hypothetical protein [Ruegeria sp. Alg231-54]
MQQTFVENKLSTQRLPDEATLFSPSLAVEPLVRNPKLPKYSVVRKLLGILPNVAKSDVRGLVDAKFLEAGSKERPLSWKKPDQWIAARLSGSEADIAIRIWHESEKTVNPAIIYGAYLLINRYELLSLSDGIYTKDSGTTAFCMEWSNKVFEVDYYEGLYHVLSWASERGQLDRSELQAAWCELCYLHSRMTSQKSILTSLSQRISNLKERGLLEEVNGCICLTNSGNAYTDWLHGLKIKAA